MWLWAFLSASFLRCLAPPFSGCARSHPSLSREPGLSIRNTEQRTLFCRHFAEVALGAPFRDNNVKVTGFDLWIQGGAGIVGLGGPTQICQVCNCMKAFMRLEETILWVNFWPFLWLVMCSQIVFPDTGQQQPSTAPRQPQLHRKDTY